MKILFVQAISTENIKAEMVYPIGIVTLAGILDKKHKVDIIDLNIEQDPYGALKDKVINYKPDAVCISLRNIDPLGNKLTSLIPPFTAAVKLIKNIADKVVIIAGGTGFSLFPERIMELHEEISYGIVGEAEESLALLLDNLEDPQGIKGLCHYKNGQFLVEEPSRQWDMENVYNMPARHLWNPDKYKGNNYVQPVGIETKRGCPFKCSYCVYPNLQGRNVRCRNPKSVVDEIEFINKQYGINIIHFTDPVVNIPSGHLEEICEQIIKRKIKIKWSGFFREDHINKNNIHLFEDSGCDCFSFSPDGMTQKALDVLGKQMKIEQVKKAITLAADTKVISVYHFMVNVPGETDKTIEESKEFINWIYDTHDKNKNLGTLVFNNIRIYPNTPIYHEALKSGEISEKTDLLYPVYYNPSPYDNLRYQLESMHMCRNIFMWQEVVE